MAVPGNVPGDIPWDILRSRSFTAGHSGGCQVGGDPSPGALGLALDAGVLVQVRRRRRA